MNTCLSKKIIAWLLLAMVASAGVAASEIYHWVDENGVSHYSQQPPDKNTPNVSTQKIRDTAPSDGAEAEDIYDTKAHEERMAEWRKQREQERMDARDRKEQAARQQSLKYPQPESYDRRPYLYPPIYRPHPRPPYQPERPIYNPRPPTTSLSHGG